LASWQIKHQQSHALELRKLFTLEAKDDIFLYYTQLRQQIKIIQAQGEMIGRQYKVPEWISQSLLLVAAWQHSDYRQIALDFSMENKEFTADELLHELQRKQMLSAHLNGGKMAQRESAIEVQAKVVKESAPKVCFGFQKGKCTRANCPYLHEKRSGNAQSSATSKPAAKRGKCTFCHKRGHSEDVCRSKLGGGAPKAKANECIARIAHVIEHDGFFDDEETPQTRVNVLVAEDGVDTRVNLAQHKIAATRWCVDSGANRDICKERHLFAADLKLKEIKIGEAGVGHTFTAQAEGCIPLRLGKEKLPLFARTIYAEQVNENIMSVPEAIDNGFSILFDKSGVRFYNKQVDIAEKPTLRGVRDPQNRLFYISFPVPAKRATSAVVSQAIDDQRNKRSAHVESDEPPTTQVSVNLSKTYHEFASDVMLWHTRMGHVNVRLMALAKPELKGASTLECDDCVRGKMHKFPHSGKRPDAAQLSWKPGEYYTCDLFGPLVRTPGGARYAAFYIDLKSRFVYVRALKQKDEHYTAFVEVICDSRARSGNNMRFFKSDGDGIFTGASAADIYRDYAIRHIRSAPGDSAGNDVAERTIRTFAELTTTNLLHANAPTTLWAEAMTLVQYVWNHIPVMKVKEGVLLACCVT